MRAEARLIVWALPLLALAASPADAHDRCGSGHHAGHGCAVVGQDGAGCRDAGCAGTLPSPTRAPGRADYDLDTVTTLSGPLAAVGVAPARPGWPGGLRIVLETDAGAMPVLLGPTWYLEREGLSLTEGDTVEVTGSVVSRSGESLLVARDVRKEAKVVRLRDERGSPLWLGVGER